MTFPQSRQAVAALFLANGFVVGSWAPMIPEFKARLGVDESGLGLLILGFGIGSLIAMPICGAIIAKSGSQKIVLTLSAIMIIVLMALIHAPNVPLAAMAMVFAGGLVGGMDVSMNANAVSVERDMHKAIMSSCHGFWSLGGFIGAGLGGTLIARLGVEMHVLIATTIIAALVAFAWHKTMDDEADASSSAKGLKPALPRSALPYLIGAMALACMIPEGSVVDWGALYLRQELGADVAQSGLAFAAFAGTMAVMRFLGDSIRNRFGATNTFRVSTLFAGLGLAIAAEANVGELAVLGFAIAGIGVANLVPIAFSAAGNLPGYAPGVAISVVTFMGYSGILFAPSLIGFIAEHTGFAVIFLALAVVQIAVFFAAPIARHADGITKN
jgi:predicted MFS family arabinose efflux permease